MSIYTVSNVDDDDIYTCEATLSHASEYVLTSDSESGQGYVFVIDDSESGRQEPTKNSKKVKPNNEKTVIIVLATILAIVLLALIIIIIILCFLKRVCSSKHGIHVATDDNELLLQNVGKRDTENEEIGKDKDPHDLSLIHI